MPAAAAAQPANQIRNCRATTETDAARAACLEAALSALTGEPIGIEGSAAAEPEGQAAVAAKQAADAEEARLAAAETAPEPAASGLGAEQVIARVERDTDEGREKRKKRLEDEALDARILDFAVSSSGALVMVLDNGQVWAQRAGDRREAKLREGDQPAVRIRRGAISGYRMEIDDPNVTLIVERLK